MIERGKAIVHDVLKLLLVGIAAAAAVGLLLLGGGVLFGENGIRSGLETAKDGLLICFSLGLFLLAGMLLRKGKKPEQFDKNNGWRKHFSIVGPKIAIAVVCAAFLIVASVADYILMM